MEGLFSIREKSESKVRREALQRQGEGGIEAVSFRARMPVHVKRKPNSSRKPPVLDLSLRAMGSVRNGLWTAKGQYAVITVSTQ